MWCGGGAMSLHIQLQEGEGVWSSIKIWGNRFGLADSQLAGWAVGRREKEAMLSMALHACRSWRKQSVPKPWGREGDKREIKTKLRSEGGQG